MARLGISVYPEHAPLEKNKAYIKDAAECGFTRIFTCLLSVEGRTKQEILEEFREMIDYAHTFNMEVILDVAPFVFEKLGASYDDLSFFKEMHADGIRLDEGFGGQKESLMTYNKEGLKIEINASFGNGYIDNIISHYPDKDKMITCHNFYPQRYTGLSEKHFNLCNNMIKKHGLKIAAFVSSQAKGTFGPWPVNEGLCTLESHRDLPIDVQMRHLVATGMIDDVIIGNQFATREELETCAKIQPGLLTFKIDYEKELHPTERKVIFEHEHYVRGDMSEYMARSTFPRVTYASESVPPENTRDLRRGDVIVVNDNYSRYKGELHIVLKDMPNDGRKNVIGRIPDNEMMLLDYIEPWRPFGFME
ncbi:MULTISPECIES: MupG family TIM beta-alpha barrel fold protein [Breznakia]|uniref:Outer surface protein n=1 Tax=Breznakia blatticola TaxID=1754012 RepID=A0A4R8A2J9_9FIRM|nr:MULTISPECIES: MupG family TIM beta-alpha barrel fold protein [Breznakia]MDH6367195.1 hypothetical protein [Breznakia sp. PH1-1]MDH6404385.1 hypothetical protein [Breznakia sp. PF1-11]MDH6412094.1 hypothetical protein [Breznakia sp. PFB1-11]MDH6414373.1 hypothetical protein [Breznakia sp. PFB1-14]MDH6416697.1 hypothetical protein [Breznakia sp. PFB1-4]